MGYSEDDFIAFFVISAILKYRAEEELAKRRK